MQTHKNVQDLHKDLDDSSYRSTVWNTQGALLGPTAWSYTTVFLLACCSASLLLTTSIFSAIAKTGQEGGKKFTPSLRDDVLKGRVKSKYFEKHFDTEVKVSNWEPKEEFVTKLFMTSKT